MLLSQQKPLLPWGEEPGKQLAAPSPLPQGCQHPLTSPDTLELEFPLGRGLCKRQQG